MEKLRLLSAISVGSIVPRTFCVALFCMGITGPAHASFLSHDLQIHSSWSTPDERVFSPVVFTVGVGSENISSFAWDVTLDVSAGNLRFDFPVNVNFGGSINGSNGWVITDVSSNVPDMVGVSFNSDTSMQLLRGGPFDTSDIDFDADRITINFDGKFINAGSILSLDVEFAPVPVPAALWLFGSGLLGLVGMARRKKAA